jgi:hypothetical protein
VASPTSRPKVRRSLSLHPFPSQPTPSPLLPAPDLVQMSPIMTLPLRSDPFAGVEDDIAGGSTDAGYVHIRVQKRNGRKCITTVSGVNPKIDLAKVLKSFKKVCRWALLPC